MYYDADLGSGGTGAWELLLPLLLLLLLLFTTIRSLHWTYYYYTYYYYTYYTYYYYTYYYYSYYYYTTTTTMGTWAAALPTSSWGAMRADVVACAGIGIGVGVGVGIGNHRFWYR